VLAWEAAYAVIAAEIAAGRYPVGTWLPPQATLAEMLGTSQTTIRSAESRLERDGLIRREQGRGTLVLAAEPVPRSSLEDRLTQLEERVADLAVQVAVLTQHAGAPPAVAGDPTGR
jgi:GntR family transcriptional regulator